MENSPTTLAIPTEVGAVFRAERAKDRLLRTVIPWADTLRTPKSEAQANLRARGERY